LATSYLVSFWIIISLSVEHITKPEAKHKGRHIGPANVENSSFPVDVPARRSNKIKELTPG
jgi:hypothetical protein